LKCRLPNMVLASLAILVVFSGCSSDDPLPPDVAPPRRSSSKVDLFELAWDNFDHLGEHEPDEPLPETIARLNQWIRSEPPMQPWKPDPLVAALPVGLLATPLMQRLGSTTFVESDGPFLHEAILMRQTSQFIVGDETDPLRKAELLFDWTMRNIQLDPNSTRLWPRESLLLGRAAPLDREWVFLSLARQQGLDVVWLAIPRNEENTQFSPWCPALFHNGELYPFDLLWGSPVPTADGQGVAALSEIVDNDDLLRQLDVSGKFYPYTADALQEVAALIAAREPFLSRRMRIVQERLDARNENHGLVLHVAPSELASKVEELSGVLTAQLWLWPFEYAIRRESGSDESKAMRREIATRMLPFRVRHIVRTEARQEGEFEQPVTETTIWPLWAGRLHHLAGRFERRSEQDVATQSRDEFQSQLDEKAGPARLSAAIPFYLIARTKIQELDDPPDEPLSEAQLQELKQVGILLRRMELDASYWLGLIRSQQGDETTAADFFQRSIDLTKNRTAAAPFRYNLGRAWESLGKHDQAIEQYRQERSPGSLLRIKRLESRKEP